MKKYRTKPWAKGLACGLFVLAMTVSVICLGNVRWLAYHGGYQWEGTRQLVEEEEAVWVENLTNQLADGYRAYRDGDQSLDVKRYVEDENFFFTIKDLEGNTLLASDTLGDYREKTSWSMQVGGTVQWSHIDQYYDSYEARDLALDQLGSTYEELQNVSLVEDEEGYRLTADVARTVGKETVVLTGFLRSELSPTGQVYQGIQYAENMGFYRYEFLAGAILGLVLGLLSLGFLLWSAGLRVLVLETAHPAAIRRQVSLCEAVYEGETAVEGMRGIRVETLADADVVWAQNAVPILIDPTGACLPQARPAVLVDAIIAKKNLGTTREMAPLTIALGPGFTAGQDVDVVVETKRGHKLGRIIREGSAAPNSGVPGIIGGYGAERVLHAQAAGIFCNLHSIADFVEAGEAVAEIETPDGQRLPVVTQISGILRGLLRDGYPVTKGFKVADVDPRRAELENCFLISDKARCIAGSVLELITAACWN